jgi:hypothetical protein
MIIDQRTIADWRLKMVQILLSGGDMGDLFKEIGPEAGQLLALANAAVRIKTVFYEEDDGALMHMAKLNGTVTGAMLELRDLEEASMRANGIVPLHPK